MNDYDIRVLHGSRLTSQLPQTGDGSFLITDSGTFPLFERAHTVMLGQTGYGKSTTLKTILRDAPAQYAKRILFDPKDDFQCFCQEGRDLVLGRDCFWNLCEEVLFNPRGGKLTLEELYVNSIAISSLLFAQRLDPKNCREQYFPLAARVILASCLTVWCDCGQDDPEFRRKYLNNREVIRFFSSARPEDILNLVSGYEQFRHLQNYLTTEPGCVSSEDILALVSGSNRCDCPQETLNNVLSGAPTKDGSAVLAELTLTLQDLLIGSFAQPGDFSVRRFLYEPQNSTLLLKYDFSRSAAFGVCTRAILDLALSESLAPGAHLRGKVAFFLDELPLVSVPPLKNLPYALNYGLGMNCRIWAAFQNISQLYQHYGKDNAHSILAGFTQMIFFRLDRETADAVGDILGSNDQIRYHFAPSGRRVAHRQVRPAVENWELKNLLPGEAVVRLPDNSDPFRVHFREQGG